MTIYNDDCLNVLNKMEDESVDSLITDPPAGISFMGKEWDHHKGGRLEWINWMREVMKECLRVMKPGAHGLVWAIPRTSHWTATALEDAGFEIRDVVTHLFGSGFPKSHDISKAIDKQAGVERDVLGPNLRPDGSFRVNTSKSHGNSFQVGSNDKMNTSPTSPEAKQWQGWGTALKPASEHWILIRKPCSEDTIAKNVLKHGTGGINIDASRIEGIPRTTHTTGNVVTTQAASGHLAGKKPHGPTPAPSGRFPANLVLSHNPDCEELIPALGMDQNSSIPEMLHGSSWECTTWCVVAELDRQSGNLKTNPGTYRRDERDGDGNTYRLEGRGITSLGNSGGASRFFYCPKASKKDKGADNTHPTVKNSVLMSYLIKLISPPEGVVLDPFMGSGSTGVAAKQNGFNFIGIEKEIEYFEIAKRRMSFVLE